MVINRLLDVCNDGLTGNFVNLLMMAKTSLRSVLFMSWHPWQSHKIKPCDLCSQWHGLTSSSPRKQS